ncbi:MAG TPA: FAD-dependent oxidoreductase [Candidatus Polarisedimenticolia bacterium]|jgi:glycine/D-amino acid oxidase-like deaminating enzyme|nr:FAD-dependent oxidoreductase [Candidatus Polarisedimenticolia bacterium]
MSRTADVVIIGGGIQGASIAYHLTLRGQKNVVVLEKDTLASGCSGRTGGMIRQHYSTGLVTEIARQGRDFFSTFDRVVGGHSGWVQCGLVYMVTGKDREALEHNIALGRKHGVPTRLIDAREARERVPGLNTEGAVAFGFEENAGYGDGYGTTVAFADRAREQGATILQATPATGIRLDNGRVTGVTTPKDTIATRTVVNAAGPWADRIGRMVGLDLPLKLELIEEAVIRVQAPDTYPIDTPSVYDFVNGLSFRPEGTGHTVVAEGSSYFKGDLDADGYPTRPSDRYIEDVSERLAKAMPRLASGTPRGGWAGLLEGTPDFHPIMGRAPGVEGLLLCYGFSGHGFKEAPVTGRLIAELILDGRTSLDIAPLGFERFAKGELLRSKYKDDPVMA